MGINGYTKVCGLIGNPVEHTLSPIIHNTLAQRMGHNLVYVPFCVNEEELEAALKGAYGLNLFGLNVTVPYKSDVIKSLVEIDDLAMAIGAVNTLVRTSGGFKGYNTDMDGLYRAMVCEGIQIEGEEILLLGSGGVARAVAFLCAKKGAKRVYLLNRTLRKAEIVAQEVNTALNTTCIQAMALSDYQLLPDRKFLAIQGTSVGMHPDEDQAVITDSQFYSKIHTGYDLIYKPSHTKFMSLVEQAGGNAFSGLKMLLYQGVIAYELWNEVSVPEKDADDIYDILIRQMTDNK